MVQPRSGLNVNAMATPAHSTRCGVEGIRGRFPEVPLYVRRAMGRRANHRRSRTFLFGTFSFVDGCGKVDNCARCALYMVSFRKAMWEDRTGDGGLGSLGHLKPVPKITPASCPWGFREDRTLSGVSSRIPQEWSGNLTKPLEILP